VAIDEDKVWNGVATGAAVGAAAASKPLVEGLWRLLFRRDPPGNPASRETTWGEALLWALFVGALVGVIRLLAQRLAAEAWQRVRGSYPGPLESTRP